MAWPRAIAAAGSGSAATCPQAAGGPPIDSDLAGRQGPRWRERDWDRGGGCSPDWAEATTDPHPEQGS
eukprot:14045584-Alexandrium_andersonii.AAC.1